MTGTVAEIWLEEYRQGLRMLFPFGHGLRYTRFAYSDLKLRAKFAAPDGSRPLLTSGTNQIG